jgi:hypothetical protein
VGVAGTVVVVVSVQLVPTTVCPVGQLYEIVAELILVVTHPLLVRAPPLGQA